MEETRKVYPMGDMVMYGRQPSPLAGKTVVCPLPAKIDRKKVKKTE